jgi:carbamoyltransferase
LEKDLKYVLGINRHHNGSVCLLENGEVIYHLEEERLSRLKTDHAPLLSVIKVKEYTDTVDMVGSVGFYDLVDINEMLKKPLSVYDALLYKILKDKDYPPHESYFRGHHLSHAAIAFYNSGFTNAVCVVVDGNGSTLENLKETESIFTASYPADFKCLHKEGLTDDPTDRMSVGHIFESMCEHFGFAWHEAGKVMGLSAYGKPNANLPKILIDGRANPEMFAGRNFIYEYEDTFQNRADIAYAVQKECQEYVTSFILKAIDLSKNKNVCLSGGFFLNCVANYEYLKHLPEDVNLYVEPISGDAGLSIGVAKHIWHHRTGDTTIRKLNSLYCGPKPKLNIGDDVKSKKVTPKDVAELLRDGKIIAMFQGRSEAGPRALGNRSILFNPSIKNGKDIINAVKRRESFRPFAGTILAEKVHEWFDMRGLKESPFMMFAVNCLEDKKDKIPSIVHVDGTCRIQTLSFEQNVCYYNLIKAFEDLTGIPILFNTSFNLAGDPLVETLEEAIHTFNNSEIDYLYIPEKELLIF